jgi:glycosyltransferase involved in cell wall biosynthesis
MSEKIGVLFVLAQEEFLADAAVHVDLMRYLARERFEVHVACAAADGRDEPPSLRNLRQIPGLRVRPTHFVPKAGASGFSALAQLISGLPAVPADFLDLGRYVRANRIRIIHSTDRPRNALYSVLLGKLTGAKSIVHMHVKWSTAYGRAARWSVQEADAVFAISEYVRGTVVADGRAPGDVHTVLNAIDPARWDPAADGAALRRELGVPDDVPLLASVSRLFEWKGQRELLQAFALVRAEHPNARLLIVGQDASGEGAPFTQELKQLTTELKLSEHVSFTGGRSDIPRVMAACDIFALPSFEEPFGLVFLEAMAMARPVIAIGNGGTPEVVEHGKSGLLSAPWDVPGLAANISQLLADPALRARMGLHGRERVLDYFNAHRMASDAARAYEAVLRA